MATNEYNGSPSDELELLRKQNAELQRQVDTLKAERDANLKHMFGLANENTPPEDVVQGWRTEEKEEVKLLDGITEVRYQK